MTVITDYFFKEKQNNPFFFFSRVLDLPDLHFEVNISVNYVQHK